MPATEVGHESKQFMIQAIAVNVIGTAIADVDAIIQKGVIVLAAQNKEIGRFRVRHLAAAGGTLVGVPRLPPQIPLALSTGRLETDIWRVIDLLIDTNQSFKASLLMPTTTTYTVTASTTVEIDLCGYEIRPAA